MSSDSSSIEERQIGDYLIKDSIGNGGYAKVYLGTHIPTKEKVAIKVIDKEELFEEEINKKRLLLEISILKKVRHKNIIKLYEIMETPQTIYLVMEYCNSGELFDFIVGKDKLSENQACSFYQEIIDALSYLHSQNIVHRDVKPENILLNKINRIINCKLIDFGISRTFQNNELVSTPCGTASYASPEMHKGEAYNPILSEVWSSGILLFSMVCGYLPFSEEDELENINNILKGNYEFPDDIELSPEIKDLIKHLLDINPETRYNLDKIKQHPWFNLVPYNSRPGILIGYHRIPIDPKILTQCESYGYNKEEVIDSVRNNRYNKNSALYYILLKKLEIEGTDSISDLFSDQYLEYINDKNNLLTEEEIIDFRKELENENNKEKYLDNEFENKKEDKSLDDIYSEKSEKSIEDNNNNNNNLDLSSENEQKKDNKDLILFPDEDKNDQENNNNKDELEELNDNIEIPGMYSDNDIYRVILKSGNKNKENLENLNKKEENQLLKNDENEIKKEIEELKDKENEKKETVEETKLEVKSSKNVDNEIIDKNMEDKKEEKENEKEIENLKINEISNNIKNNNISHKLKSSNSFNFMSKDYEKLNSGEKEIENKNKDDILNESFTIRLTDTIKENILKMKNPKKKEGISNFKILNNINQLNNEKPKNAPKIYVRKVKFGQKEKILSKGNKKDHTIIINRNASFHLYKRRNNNANEDIKIPKNNMHYSLRKTFKRKKYIKYKTTISKIDNNKKNINININKMSIKYLRTSNKIELKNKAFAYNKNNKNDKKLINKIPKGSIRNYIDKITSQRKSNYTYMKGNSYINKTEKIKKEIKNNNIRFTMQIRSRNDQSNYSNIFNSNTISVNSRRDKIFNSFIINKRESNKNIYRPKFSIKNLYATINSKENKKFSKVNNKNIKKNANMNKSFGYRVNYNTNKLNSTKNIIKLTKNKIMKNNEIKNIIHGNKLNFFRTKSKNKESRSNKSTEFRTKFGYSVRNKNDLNMGIAKIIKIKEKQINNNDKSVKNVKIKEKIKIDKNNKYKGPLDTKNLIIAESIETIQEKINNALNLNKIKFWKLNHLKYICSSKNMDKFCIEICFLGEISKYKDSIKTNNNNDNINSEKKNIFYLKIILSKENNNSANIKLIEKVIDNIKSK